MPESQSYPFRLSMKILRSVAAILIGYFVFAASAVFMFKLAARDPHAHQSLGFVVFSVFYGMLFAWVGGRLAARIAPSRGSLHANIVAGIIALGATVSLLTSPSADATWSQWTAIFFMAPCAFLAGVPTPQRVKAR